MLLCMFAAVVSSCVLLTAAPKTTQDLERVLVVESARPVAKAMVILEDRYQQPITYEEGPYIYQDDVEDLTVAANAPRRILAPKRWRIESEIRLPSNVTKPELVSLINRFLRSATQSRGLSRDSFRVLQSNYGLHVVPTQVRDFGGAETPVTALLDVQITLLTSRTDLYSVLRSFCDAVSEATGAKVSLAPVSVDFARRSSMIVADRQRARDVLIRLLEEQGLVLSWHLLHDPTGNAFILGLGQPGRLMPLK